MYKHIVNKFRSGFGNSKGFTLVEILVAMAILTLIIMAFSALFLQSYAGIINAGNKSKASYDAQADVEERIAQENANTTDDFNIIFGAASGTVTIPIKGGVINSVKTKNGQKSEMDSFLALVPTMSIAPDYLVEGYTKPVTLTFVGAGTHFSSTSVFTIKDKDGNDEVTRAVDVVNTATECSILLTETLVNSESPYLFTIKTGNESVSAKLDIRPPINYAAAGDSRTVAVSSDKINWLVDYWGSAHNINGITYHNGKFVAVGDSGTDAEGDTSYGKVMYSDEGYKWTSMDINSADIAAGNSPTNFQAVTWGNGKYVAVGTGGVVYTFNEDLSINSCRILTDSSEIQHDFKAVIWDGTRFVAVGAEGVMAASSDGISWTVTMTPFKNNINAITSIQGVGYSGAYISGYIIAGNNGLLGYYSAADGAWKSLNVVTQDNVTLSADFNSIACSGNLAIAAGGNFMLAMDLTNIANGTPTGKVIDRGQTVKSIIWSKGEFWAIQNGNILIHSYGYTDWYASNTGSGTNLNSLAIR